MPYHPMPWGVSIRNPLSFRVGPRKMLCCPKLGLSNDVRPAEVPVGEVCPPNGYFTFLNQDLWRTSDIELEVPSDLVHLQKKISSFWLALLVSWLKKRT